MRARGYKVTKQILNICIIMLIRSDWGKNSGTVVAARL